MLRMINQPSSTHDSISDDDDGAKNSDDENPLNK